MGGAGGSSGLLEARGVYPAEAGATRWKEGVLPGTRVEESPYSEDSLVILGEDVHTLQTLASYF